MGSGWKSLFWLRRAYLPVLSGRCAPNLTRPLRRQSRSVGGLRRNFGGRGRHPKARAALLCGFGETEFGKVVSFTAPANEATFRVMQKIGMQHSPRDDFDPPVLTVGERLRAHVLYRKTAQEFH